MNKNGGSGKTGGASGSNGKTGNGKTGSSKNGKRKNGNGSRSKHGSAGIFGNMVRAATDGLSRLADAVSSDSDSLNAMDLLKAQHRAVDKLFAQIQEAGGSQKRAAFRELAELLTIHAVIEEKIFYPAVHRPATRDLLLESVEEHLGMKRLLADLISIDPEMEGFDAKIKVLEEQVHHHAIQEEEGKLFPRVRENFDTDYMAALAGEMIALMVDLQQKSEARQAAMIETEEATPI